jgi:hypothetical protein
MSKTARNDVTGDLLRSKPSTDMFESGYDRIWGKKNGKNFEKEIITDKDESRIDVVGQNGNDGLHYEVELNKSTGEPEKKPCTNCECGVKGCE